MSPSMKLASAAVAVVAIGALALWQLMPAPGGAGSSPSAPTATVVPTTEPTPRTTATAEVPPPLSETFTSDVHGVSISYPAGWVTQAATESWDPGADLPWTFGAPATDFIFDPNREHDLFLGLASQPLGDESASEWVDRMLAISDPAPCAETETVQVDGAQGLLATCDEPLRAFVTEGQRGYAIFLYRSDDDPRTPVVYGPEFFNELLESVQLRPGDAAAAAGTEG